MTGNTAADRIPVERAGLRVSDAERDAVAAELAEHLKDGRLDAAEFDERVGQPSRREPAATSPGYSPISRGRHWSRPRPRAASRVGRSRWCRSCS